MTPARFNPAPAPQRPPLPAVIRGFVGIPFADKGFSFDGCHCYGLCWLVFLRAADITLPKYDLISSAETIAIARAMKDEAKSGRWRRLRADETPRAFDMAEMIEIPRPGARAWHCGIVAGPGRLLHCERGVGSHLADLADPRIAPRVVGFHRHVALEGRTDG
ncbi:hypothetical protein [Oricola sp.]|uniref:hypothetical protein n=1 Tax=Oricola sp. TaxID=1979950 RepID=UPI0025DFA926|nr:hypothetical protein [Oricola sp.]MCI5075544.1 hypothetical protein [Oricola sp.]